MTIPDRQILAASLAPYGIGRPGGVLEIPFAQDAGLTHDSNIKTFTHGRSDIDACYVAQLDEKTMVLGFRGTALRNPDDKLQAIFDWINNLSANPVSGKDENIPGTLHEGFKHSALGLMNNGVAEHIRQNLAADMTLVVTGYSKGAALTPIAAAWIAQNIGVKPDRIKVRMFEPPRAGDPVFRSWFNNEFKDAERYEYQDDIVPHVPPVRALTALITNIPEFGKFLGYINNLEDWDYTHVGKLNFIDWNDKIIENHATLFARRVSNLGLLLAKGEYDKPLADHLPCGNIYDVLWEGHETRACELLKDQLAL